MESYSFLNNPPIGHKKNTDKAGSRKGLHKLILVPPTAWVPPKKVHEASPCCASVLLTFATGHTRWGDMCFTPKTNNKQKKGLTK